MNIVGRLVQATAGRDKGGLFCVLDEQGDYLLLADGRSRKVERPKRKKRKHTALVENPALYGGAVTNRAVRAFIRANSDGLKP